MSKITKALEKAARERLQHHGQEPTVKAAAPVIMPVTRFHLGDIATVGEIEVDPHIVAATDPSSPIAEQYRILRTNLQSLRLRPGPKVVVVTSAVHSEGKSVTSINLALSLARQESLRVVLVDADMRKSSVQRWLGLDVQKADGLSTVLSRGGELNGALMRLQSPLLTILPAGPTPREPAELLESTAMRRLIATLKAQFDMIIVDAPPVLPVADPGILASHADGVILVVRAGHTQRKTVVQARAMLDQAKANLIGCVLTHVEYYLPGYYKYYRYYRYGAKSGSGNGHDETPVAGGAEPSAS